MTVRPAWGGLDPADMTAWTVVQAGHAVGRRFWTVLGELGLSPVQFGVLLQLDRQPDQSNAQLARAVHVTPQTMSELTGSMVTRGLLDRDPVPGPGRRITARLTPAGRRALRRCERVVADLEASLGLTDAQSTTLRRLLGRVIDSGAESAR